MRSCTAVIALLLSTLAHPVHAQMKDENLLVSLPQGFKVAFQERKGKALISEMIPAGDTLEDWSQMVTTQIFFGGLPTSPEEFYSQMRQGWLSSCKGGNGKLVRTGMENGYPIAFGFLTCPLNPATNKPEAAWIKAIKGNDSFYVVQRATRQEPAKELITEFSKYLSAVKVCDSRLPERPCPQVQPPTPP